MAHSEARAEALEGVVAEGKAAVEDAQQEAARARELYAAQSHEVRGRRRQTLP